MSKIKKYSIFTLILSGLSIPAFILSHLALTDISHGGEDLSSEWLFLRIASVIFLTFTISTIFTLKHILKEDTIAR